MSRRSGEDPAKRPLTVGSGQWRTPVQAAVRGRRPSPLDDSGERGRSLTRDARRAAGSAVRATTRPTAPASCRSLACARQTANFNGPAAVAELVYAHGSGPCGRKPLGVRVPPAASPSSRITVQPHRPPTDHYCARSCVGDGRRRILDAERGGVDRHVATTTSRKTTTSPAALLAHVARSPDPRLTTARRNLRAQTAGNLRLHTAHPQPPCHQATPAQSHPFSSATRSASARLRASSLCIADERWLRTVPGER